MTSIVEPAYLLLETCLVCSRIRWPNLVGLIRVELHVHVWNRVCNEAGQGYEYDEGNAVLRSVRVLCDATFDALLRRNRLIAYGIHVLIKSPIGSWKKGIVRTQC